MNNSNSMNYNCCTNLKIYLSFLAVLFTKPVVYGEGSGAGAIESLPVPINYTENETFILTIRQDVSALNWKFFNFLPLLLHPQISLLRINWMY